MRAVECIYGTRLAACPFRCITYTLVVCVVMATNIPAVTSGLIPPSVNCSFGQEILISQLNLIFSNDKTANAQSEFNLDCCHKC